MLFTSAFWVLPLTYLYLPKSARAYLFPHSVEIHYFFAAAPLVLTPFVRNQRKRVAFPSVFLRNSPNKSVGQSRVHGSEGGMTRLETLIELNFLNSSLSSNSRQQYLSQQYLPPPLNGALDSHPRYRDLQGKMTLIHMDEFVDMLFREKTVCDVTMPGAHYYCYYDYYY